MERSYLRLFIIVIAARDIQMARMLAVFVWGPSCSNSNQYRLSVNRMQQGLHSRQLGGGARGTVKVCSMVTESIDYSANSSRLWALRAHLKVVLLFCSLIKDERAFHKVGNAHILEIFLKFLFWAVEDNNH
jgi:hypothetical protein